MISVEDALARLIALADPLGTETIALAEAAGRVLRAPVRAARDQPPFASAAMDGYALVDPVHPGTVLRVTGQAAAGSGFGGRLGPGEAVRIFTGAPVPEDASRVVMQEHVTRDGDDITLSQPPEAKTHIRAKGIDFRQGDQISAPRRLRPADLALLAAMNCDRVTVSKRPDVAIIPTGDELVMPGETPRPDQIIASNAFAIKALAEAEGASARLLPIARDTPTALNAVLSLAQDADLIITIGGASVGDHDHVAAATEAMGLTPAFAGVALRPGKPVMAGRLGASLFLALPGNPVSSIVCAHLFMHPALRAMQGLGGYPLPSASAMLAADLAPNGPRAHYMRATLGPENTILAFADQDSSRLGILCAANSLLIRPPRDPARVKGEHVRYIAL